MSIEAMHLLPRRFDMQTSYSSSQGRLREQQHSSSQLLFGNFRKAFRTSSRGRLFRLGRYQVAAVTWLPQPRLLIRFIISPTAL